MSLEKRRSGVRRLCGPPLRRARMNAEAGQIETKVKGCSPRDLEAAGMEGKSKRRHYTDEEIAELGKKEASGI